jgi:hypothetical protein
MIAGSSANAADWVPVTLHIGQSNGDGNAQWERLSGNADYNYHGIKDLYPAVRSGQPQYTISPTGVHIYFKGGAQARQWMDDDGVWRVYAMTNTNGYQRNVHNTGQKGYFGHDGILAQLIQAATGKDTYIIKPAWGTTMIDSNFTSLEPGCWVNASLAVATQAYIARAIRDFAAYAPGKRPRIVNVSWWQGEGDATNGMSTADYLASLEIVYEVINSALAQNFVIDADKPPTWNFVGLNFINPATPALINAALSQMATNTGQYYVDSHLGFGGQGLNKSTLSVAEASPLAVGNPNASGGLDDEHSSYIAHQFVGESCFENLTASGILT